VGDHLAQLADSDGDAVSDFITITLDSSRIVARASQLIPRLGRSLRLQVAAAVVELQNYIRGEKLSGQVLHVQTGNLRNAVRAYPPANESFPIEGRVAVDRSAPYGRMQEDGTAPHEIVPVRAKALRFMVGGDVRFAMRVHHPGTRPHPFMLPSLSERRESIIARLRAGVSDALKSE